MSDIKYVHNFAKHLHNKFKDIVYEDTKHEYYNKRTNTKLISVTQSLKLFEKKFDADYWANKKALQEGITKEEMLLKWDELKKVGIDINNWDILDGRTKCGRPFKKFAKVMDFLSYLIACGAIAFIITTLAIGWMR